MIKKTKFSTITAALATIAAIAALGSIGGGIGLGQQQTALAQVIGEDEIDVGGVGDTIRDIFEDDDNGVEAALNFCPAQFENCLNVGNALPNFNDICDLLTSEFLQAHCQRDFGP